MRDVINHVNDNQIACKDWLLKHLPEAENPVVLGGWYGLIASKIGGLSVDIDPKCERIGKQLYDTRFHTEDAFEYMDVRQHKHDLIVCTSCEHMDQTGLSMLVARKKSRDIVAFQSNNYHEIEDHINCKDSLEEFLADYNFKEILYKGELDRGHYKRWMVIAK